MEKDKHTKRIPVGSIQLQFAGELILPKLPDKGLAGLFRRYAALFEMFANMEREERLLNYRLINGLMLTSYAKKATDAKQKKHLFDLKNKIFIQLANDKETRKKLAFKYLDSRNFRVNKFCDNCQKTNTEKNLPRHQWRFCNDCDVDRSFYNVLSMHHKFENGYITLFLSNDLIPQIKGLALKNKGKLDDFKEEARLDKYHDNIRNLDAFNIDCIQKMHDKIMTS